MVPALARGLRVLELMAREESELTLKSIGERLVIPIPSLWRILSVLRENGYVIFDQEQKTYRLGFKFLYLGNILLNRMGFRSQARGYLKRMVELSGETAELSARVKDQLILIDEMEGPEAVRLFSRVHSAGKSLSGPYDRRKTQACHGPDGVAQDHRIYHYRPKRLGKGVKCGKKKGIRC